MKRIVQAYNRHYFRIMPVLMRAFVIGSLVMIGLVTVSALLAGELFTSNWGVFHAVALPLLGVIWFASKKVQQMGSRSN